MTDGELGSKGTWTILIWSLRSGSSYRGRSYSRRWTISLQLTTSPKPRRHIEIAPLYYCLHLCVLEVLEVMKTGVMISNNLLG